MYAKNMTEDEALEWLEETLTEGAKPKPARAAVAAKAAAPKTAAKKAPAKKTPAAA
jgi:topoisomerase IA-like protein